MTGILGALCFLMLGIVELLILRRTLHPVLRWRYEKAKLTQSQGIQPEVIINFLRFQSLVIMPIVGFVLGNRLAETVA
jgi:hypothetical protein